MAHATCPMFRRRSLLALISVAIASIGSGVWIARLLSAAPLPADGEVERVKAEIDRIEAASLDEGREPRFDRYKSIALLGKLIFYDRNLSVNRNEACAFCHMPEAGFSGPVKTLNMTTVSYPGSVPSRFSNRKPQAISYSSYAPALHYNAGQGDFVGGAFWDMRATGVRLNSPIAEQAQGPPTNPVEMGLSDSACMVQRLSEGRYRSLAEVVWGARSLTIDWPEDVEQICMRPAPPPAGGASPLHLSASGRETANRTFDQIAEALATYEASPEINPFSSKYDLVMAGMARFTPDEKAGYELFRSSKTHCNECHRDGGPGEEPLFTDFTASNLGLPANPALAFLSETTLDASGYAANSAGLRYLDRGVGGFLIGMAQLSTVSSPDPAWLKKAPPFQGRFQVPTLRNVDKRPRPDFVKAYMHNGYLKSLKEVVHFYNTRDTLHRCKPNDPGEKTICWPAPENTATMNRRQLGNLRLTGTEENQIVAFLKTLSDGYVGPSK